MHLQLLQKKQKVQKCCTRGCRRVSISPRASEGDDDADERNDAAANMSEQLYSTGQIRRNIIVFCGSIHIVQWAISSALTQAHRSPLVLQICSCRLCCILRCVVVHCPQLAAFSAHQQAVDSLTSLRRLYALRIVSLASWTRRGRPVLNTIMLST